MTEEIKEPSQEEAVDEAAETEAEENKVLEIIKKKKIGVLTGGTSPQREISLESGEAVFNVLKEAGCNVVSIDVGKDVIQKLEEEKIDLAFNTLIGRHGADGSVQGLLEIMEIPYTGSGVLASAQAANKAAAKEIFEKHQLSTPAWELVTQKDFRSGYVMMLDLPLVLKPVTGGGSMGTTIVNKAYLQDAAMEKVYEIDKETLVGERLIDGKLLSVGIIDDIPLPVVEIESENEFYDYEAKFENPEKATFYIPAKLTQKRQKMLQDLALKAHQVLRCKDYSRVDLMLNQVGNPFILEVNTTPDLTEHSPMVLAAKAAKIEHTNLILQIVELALQEQIDAELAEQAKTESEATQNEEGEAASS